MLQRDGWIFFKGVLFSSFQRDFYQCFLVDAVVVAFFFVILLNIFFNIVDLIVMSSGSLLFVVSFSRTGLSRSTHCDVHMH